MRSVLLSLAIAVISGCQVSPLRSAPTPSIVPLPQLVTGANLRDVGDAQRGYGTRTARKTMERLQHLGVNTVAILMEGRMHELGDTEIRPPDKNEIEAIRSALIDANALGLATILIPHIYIDDGEWRGDIVLTRRDVRDAWWSSYFAFIDVATAIAQSSSATVLSIGVELKGMSKDEDTKARMNALSLRVRREFHGLLTYSANWDEAENVSFWDAVDIAGVNGYYPLVPDPVRGAEVIARRLSKLEERAHREVIVLEVGYRASPLSHVRPWEWPNQVPEELDEAAQANAWAAVLTHWLAAPGVRGLLVWVVPTDPDDPASEPRHGFNPLNKTAEEVIARAFQEHARPKTVEARPSRAVPAGGQHVQDGRRRAEPPGGEDG